MTNSAGSIIPINVVTKSVRLDEEHNQEEHFDVAVFDFDGVLAEGVWPDRDRIGDPIPAGITLLKKYAQRGYTVVVDSARPEWDRPKVIAWLRRHRVPADIVRCGKKIKASVYVDDRALKFVRPLEGGGA